MNIQFKAFDLDPIVSHVGVHQTHLSQAPQLLEQAVQDADVANRYMRMFYLFQGTQQEAFSLELQQKALSIRTVYKLDLFNEAETLRVLAIVAPGDMMQNLPLDYLLERQGIELTLLYLLPNQPLPTEYPDHDVTVFALGQSSQNEVFLSQLCELIPFWPKPFVNHPQYISLCARDKTYQALQHIDGLKLSAQRQYDRESMVIDSYPCTIRPLDSHAGQDFEMLRNEIELSVYLEQHTQEKFYVGEYLNYQSSDGQYRKFRVALIDGVPFVSHLAVSGHWVVSYMSANMQDHPSKRQEEADFMKDFEVKIAQQFKSQFSAIHQTIPLDHLVLDCAISRDGELIVFELDNSAWVHNTDSKTLFPYKDQPMKILMAAFSKMLHSKMEQAS